MTHQEILTHIETHYDDYPNFDGRTPAEVLAELPEQDERYAQGEEGLSDLLNEITYR